MAYSVIKIWGLPFYTTYEDIYVHLEGFGALNVVFTARINCEVRAIFEDWDDETANDILTTPFNGNQLQLKWVEDIDYNPATIKRKWQPYQLPREDVLIPTVPEYHDSVMYGCAHTVDAGDAQEDHFPVESRHGASQGQKKSKFLKLMGPDVYQGEDPRIKHPMARRYFPGIQEERLGMLFHNHFPGLG